MEKFIQQFCTECEYKKMGFSSYFVIKGYKEIVLHVNWNYDTNAELNAIKNLTL